MLFVSEKGRRLWLAAGAAAALLTGLALLVNAAL